MLGGPSREPRISSIYRWSVCGAVAPTLKELGEIRKARRQREAEVLDRNMRWAAILKERIRILTYDY